MDSTRPRTPAARRPEKFETNEDALLELAAFRSVAIHGGFSAASRAEGVRKATLSHRVQSLEERLGAPLFTRTTRVVRVTLLGERALLHANRAFAHLEQVPAEVAAMRAEPQGHLSVNTHPSLVSEVTAAATRLLMKHPRLDVRIDSDTRRVDLTQESFDMAVRVGALADSDLLARRIGTRGGGYYASPRYLKSAPRLRDPADLDRHPLIVVAQGPEPTHWPFVARGKTRLRRIHPRLVTPTFEAATRAAIEGLGILRAPECAVRAALQARKLQPVLVAQTPPPSPVHVLFMPGTERFPNIRVMLEELTNALD